MVVLTEAAHPGHGGRASTSSEEWEVEIQKHYGKTWGCDRIGQRLNAIDFLMKCEHLDPNITLADYLCAFNTLHRPEKKG